MEIYDTGSAEKVTVLCRAWPSHLTAMKEYGVDHAFIYAGIRAGKLEYREGAIWGNPYLRILRSQLEKYIKEHLGAARLSAGKNADELRKITKEIAALKKKLRGLESQKSELEILVRPSKAKR